MKGTKYLLVVLSLLGALLTLGFFNSRNANVAMTSLALEPAIHLVNTKLHLEQGHIEKGKNELAVAIRKSYLLKDKLEHKESLIMLGETLPDLVKIHGQIGTDSEANDQLDQLSTKTLLALVYIQIRHAKTASKEHPDEMKAAMKTAMLILEKSKFLSQGFKKDYEEGIYAQLSELVNQGFHRLSTNDKLDELLLEIHNLDVFDRDLQVNL